MLDFEKDREIPGTHELQNLEELISQHDDTTVKIAELEEQVKELSAQKRRLEESMIPELMKQIGMEKFTTTSGRSVTMKNFIFASITKKNKPLAIGWLMKNGFGDIVKNEIKIYLDSRDNDKAEGLLKDLRQYHPDQRITVHAQTLKAFVKEQRERGVEIPEDLFGIYELTKAIIK